MKKMLAVTALAFAASTSTAWAASLTPQECHSYPFVRTSHEVTHAQLEQELAELEATGYRPIANDPNYPTDIERAEKKVHAEYRQDCAKQPAGAGIQG